jgi:hypothetical protein
VKTIDRQVLGQGVADMFAEIALRVARSSILNRQSYQETESLEGQLELFA